MFRGLRNKVSVIWRITVLFMGIALLFFFYKYSNTSLSPPRLCVWESKQNHTGNGYVFALGYNDQGTGSFVNLMCLRCLASVIGGVNVVEPFMVGSLLGQKLKMSNWTNEFTFSDVFDSETAERFARRKKFSKLVSFGEFLKDAPRKLIVAQHMCEPCPISCNDPKVLERGRTFAEIYNFELVGNICLQYRSDGKSTVRDIEKQLYKEYRKSEVTVMFILFGGIEKGRFNPKTVYRFHLSLPDACYRNYYRTFPAIRPSHSVLESTEYYLQKYFHNRKYISVMIRIEMVIGSVRKDSKEAKAKTRKCLGNLMQRLNRTKNDNGIEDTFVCLDIGKYGSDRLRSQAVINNLGPEYDSFLSQVVQDGMTLAELDSTFTKSALMHNPGFVAMMQKTIAAKGEVLVVIGGSSNFHKSAIEMYKSMHRNQKILMLPNSCH